LIPLAFETKFTRLGSTPLEPGSTAYGPVTAALRLVLDLPSPIEAKPSTAEPSEAESSALVKLMVPNIIFSSFARGSIVSYIVVRICPYFSELLCDLWECTKVEGSYSKITF
jgi:hypothetical protein